MQPAARPALRPARPVFPARPRFPARPHFPARPLLLTGFLLPLALLAASAPAPAAGQAAPGGPRLPLVVLADPADPYRPLAVDIAERESAPLAASPAEALALRPDFLVWIASPPTLSDRALVEYGRVVASTGAMPALGFISGSSLDRARALYDRNLHTPSQAIATAFGDWGGARPVIRYEGASGRREEDFTPSSFTRALESSGGLLYRGHGGADYLRISPSLTIGAEDLPPRVPPLVAAYACNTFRIWSSPRSIATAFADRGTAAYIGYSYSPLPGFQMTEGFPFRHTWPAFPIGRLVQLQSAASLRAVFALPAYHLLGNPRLGVRETPPYRVVADRTGAGERIVELADAPTDILPVRIDGGAAFETTEVTGLGRVWRGDPFYNGRLQVLDVGEDRFLLLQHAGGPLTIRLSTARPIAAAAGNVWLRGLDLCLVVFPGGDRASSAAFAAIGALGLAWGAFRRRSGRVAAVALGIGALLAAAHVAYVLLRETRLDVISPTGRPVGHWMFASTWTLTAWGASVYLRAASWKGRLLGTALATLNVVSMVAVWLGWPMAFNVMVRSRLGAPLYNGRPGLLTLAGAVAIAAVVAAAFAAAARTLPHSSRTTFSSRWSRASISSR